MENKKYHTVGTFPKFIRKIIERDLIDTPNTQSHDPSLSWLGTGTSITSGGIKLVSWDKICKPPNYANYELPIHKFNIGVN